MIFDIPIPLLIFGGIALLVGLGLVANAYAEKKRREALQEVADELGLTFYQDGDPDLVAQLSDLPLFSRGRAKRITNMIQGETEDMTMGVFDYRYTVGGGKNSHTYNQSVAFFRSADLDVPMFELCPQRFFHGIGKLFGSQDVDFDTHPAFSKAFVLRGPVETGVRAVFRPEILEFFEQKPGVCVEGRSHDLVFYRHAKRVQPENLKELMNEGFEVFSMLRRKEQDFE